MQGFIILAIIGTEKDTSILNLQSHSFIMINGMEHAVVHFFHHGNISPYKGYPGLAPII